MVFSGKEQRRLSAMLSGQSKSFLSCRHPSQEWVETFVSSVSLKVDVISSLYKETMFA